MNVFLIEDDPLTLIDTGPAHAVTLDALIGALAERGVAMRDIGLVLLTHGHIDHVGNVNTICADSGAEVAAFAPLAPVFADRDGAAQSESTYRSSLMRVHGVPREMAEIAMADFSSHSRRTAPNFAIDRLLVDGSRIELASRTFDVHHRPGHSPADLVFVNRDVGVAYAGDHLLLDVLSNPVASLPLVGDRDPRRRHPAGLDYYASLERTANLPVSLVFGGHGAPIRDHRALVETRLQDLRQRRDRVFSHLAGAKRLTGWELVTRIWPHPHSPFLMLSSVLASLDLLVAEGRARIMEDDVIHYIAA